MPEKLGKVQRIAFTLTPEQATEVQRLKAEGLSQKERGRHFGVSQATMSRAEALAERAGVLPTSNDIQDHSIDTLCTNVELDLVVPVHEGERAPAQALQPVEVAGAPEHTPVHTHAQPYAQLLARIEALESHQAVVDAYLATWQAMHKAAQPMHTAAVQAMHTDVHPWEHPDDAKPERWNLLLPRGLKRALDTQAKAAGIPASTLVTRLLMAAVHTHAQAMHTAEDA